MNHCNYRVYLGRESYGTKFFDALGRTYDKMKARIKYYVYKDSVDRKEFLCDE
jgi:hypothetical protein